MAQDLRDITWTEFKQRVQDKSLSIQFTENAREISLFTLDGGLEWSARIFKSNIIDVQDFDDNFRANANQIFLPKRKIHGIDPEGVEKVIRTTGIDSVNSTNTPLSANGVFTGDWVNVEEYSNLTVMIFSDQDSAVNGFKIEHSTDGVNIDDSDAFTIFAANGLGGENRQFSFQLPVKYFRLKYTNGSVAQTEFRLQSKIHASRPKPSSHKVGGGISDENDAELTKSTLFSQNENGDWNPVGLSSSNSVKIAVTDRPSEVRNRVHIDTNVQVVALSGTPTVIHTVTPGKVFYLTSLIISAINEGNQTGDFRLRDGTAIKIPILLPKQVTGAASPLNSASPPLPEPIPFTTDVNAIEITGDITASITIVGYEEPI